MTSPFRLALLAALLTTSPAWADTVYGVKSGQTPTLNSAPPSTLFSFSDSGAPGFTVIGTITLAAAQVDVDALAVSFTHGLLGFQMSGSLAAPLSRLVSVDTATAAVTVLQAGFMSRDIRGAMFDSLDRLWAVDVQHNSLLQVNPTTGAVISETTLTVGGNTLDLTAAGQATDLAQSADGSVQLYAWDLSISGVTKPTIYTLDLATGAMTAAFVDTANDVDVTSSLVFPVGLAAGGSGAPGALFALDADGQDDVFRYDRPGFTRTEILANILPGLTTAGGGDLASYAPAAMPEPAGAAMLGLGIVTMARFRRRR